jgi:hypothetical protein
MKKQRKQKLTVFGLGLGTYVIILLIAVLFAGGCSQKVCPTYAGAKLEKPGAIQIFNFVKAIKH